MPRRPPFQTSMASSYPAVVGIDEVARGTLVGPVVAAAVFFDPTTLPAGVLERLDDSKKMSDIRRAEAAVLIRQHCLVAISARSSRVIDRIGIRAATLEAMATAWRRLLRDPRMPDGVAAIIDGLDVPRGLGDRASARPKADGAVPQVAAASIVAKQERRALSRKLALRWPGYGLEENEGYGTASHLAALKELGPSPHHRMSWQCMKQGQLAL